MTGDAFLGRIELLLKKRDGAVPLGKVLRKPFLRAVHIFRRRRADSTCYGSADPDDRRKCRTD